jgi:hypothetical protein
MVSPNATIVIRQQSGFTATSLLLCAPLRRPNSLHAFVFCRLKPEIIPPDGVKELEKQPHGHQGNDDGNGSALEAASFTNGTAASGLEIVPAVASEGVRWIEEAAGGTFHLASTKPGL